MKIHFVILEFLHADRHSEAHGYICAIFSCKHTKKCVLNRFLFTSGCQQPSFTQTPVPQWSFYNFFNHSSNKLQNSLAFRAVIKDLALAITLENLKLYYDG